MISSGLYFIKFSSTQLKMFFAILILLLFSQINCRTFKNPIIPNLDAPDPGVAIFKNNYYSVSTTNNDEPFKFPIHSSPNLQDWNLETYVFNGNNSPVWSTHVEYWAPEIHVLSDESFRVYFTTRDIQTKRLAIGAAYSTNILGPYYSLDRPLILDTTQDILDATLVNDNGTLHLIWKGSEWMYLRELNSDGLSFKTEETNLILRNDLDWEWYIIEGPWVVKRNNVFYLFYSGNEYCGNNYSVGVARSMSLQGPWEKHPDPILVSTDTFKGPGHCSVVRDVDGVSDVMVFHAYKAGEVCTPYPRLMHAQSVAWSMDGWPYMTN